MFKLLEKLSFSWFDVVVLVALVIGVYRGRRNGMSEELLPLLQVLAMIVVGAYYYEPVAKVYARVTSSSLLVSNIVAYLAFVLVIKAFFTFVIQRAATERIVSIDLFGKFEYYLGMIAGALRFAGFLVIALAVVHARATPKPSPTKPKQTITEEALGNLINPEFSSLQEEIFEKSFSGRMIKEHLGHMLIAPLGKKKARKNPDLDVSELHASLRQETASPAI